MHVTVDTVPEGSNFFMQAVRAIDVARRRAGMTADQLWVLGLSAVGALMIGLDALVVLTALDKIRKTLDASLVQLEWTVNAYTLSFAVLLMPAAALGEKYGRRLVLSAGIGIFTVASALCALAPDIESLIAARAVQGVGAAAVMPMTLTLLAANFSAEKRPAALGAFASVTGLAILGGPVLGGAVVESASWQWIFWLNVPIGIALIPLIRRRVPESKGAARRLDLPGIGFIVSGTLGLMWALVRGNSIGWTDPQIVSAWVLGGGLLAAFVGWELRAAAPLLPMRLFAHRGFAAGNAAAFAIFGTMFGVVFWFAQYLQTVQHNGSLGAGLRLAPMTVTLSIVAPWAGRRINRIGERNLVATGLAMQAVGAAAVAWVAHERWSYAAMLAPLVILGVGASIAIPAAQSAVVSSAPPAAAGAASGTFNTLRQQGSAFGVAISSAIFASNGDFRPAAAFEDGFVPAIAAIAVLALVGALAATFIPSRRRPGATLSAEPGAEPAALPVRQPG